MLLSSVLVAIGRLMVKEKTLPPPSVLSTIRLPPINSIRFFAMHKPKPVPPYLRLIEGLACVNGEKQSG